MKKKKIRMALAILALAVLCGGWYAYHEFTRKVKDLKYVKASMRLEAPGLIRVFERDEDGSNKRYLDKIIAVSGRVKSVETNERNHITVVLGEANSLSSVRCSMDSLHQSELPPLLEGSEVTLKGACAGFNKDELLGSDVLLNRCVKDN